MSGVMGGAGAEAQGDAILIVEARLSRTKKPAFLPRTERRVRKKLAV
jgi:hypothetical protein